MLCSPLSNDSNNNNNNNIRQQNYEIISSNPMASTTKTTVRKLRNGNIGSLSPLSQSSNQMMNTTTTSSITSTVSPVNQFLIERRQAVSMERLNILNTNGATSGAKSYLNSLLATRNGDKENHSRSYNCQSDSNMNSMDESPDHSMSTPQLNSPQTPSSTTTSATSEQQIDTPGRGATGLTRSASRVSRFRSAKEFFERLSSVNNNSSPNIRPEKSPLLDRPRGNVANRYTALTIAAAAVSVSVSAKAAPNNSLNSLNSPQRSRIILPASLPFNNNNNNNNSNINVTSNSNNNICDRTVVSTTRSVPNSDIHRSNNVSYSESPQSPNITAQNIIFQGDNVIVGNGSLLNKRNKQLKIKFDEDSTLTFEYPSEEALLAEPESPVPDEQQQLQARHQQEQPSKQQNSSEGVDLTLKIESSNALSSSSSLSNTHKSK